MANPQVLRYSALGAGILYGLYHQRKLSSQAKAASEQAKYQHKEALIEQAKAEWARKHPVKDTGDCRLLSSRLIGRGIVADR